MGKVLNADILIWIGLKITRNLKNLQKILLREGGEFNIEGWKSAAKRSKTISKSDFKASNSPEPSPMTSTYMYEVQKLTLVCPERRMT